MRLSFGSIEKFDVIFIIQGNLSYLSILTTFSNE